MSLTPVREVPGPPARHPRREMPPGYGLRVSPREGTPVIKWLTPATGRVEAKTSASLGEAIDAAWAHYEGTTEAELVGHRDPPPGWVAYPSEGGRWRACGPLGATVGDRSSRAAVVSAAWLAYCRGVG